MASKTSSQGLRLDRARSVKALAKWEVLGTPAAREKPAPTRKTIGGETEGLAFPETVLVVQWLLTDSQVKAWGWRIPFVIGAIIQASTMTLGFLVDFGVCLACAAIFLVLNFSKKRRPLDASS